MATLKVLRASLLRISSVPKRSATTVAGQSATIPFAQQRPLPVYQSKWKRTTDVPLNRESFLDLMFGRTPTIREEGFLSPELCWKHEQILDPQLAPYKHNTGPLLNKVGVAQFEYQAQSAKDFKNRSEGTPTARSPLLIK